MRTSVLVMSMLFAASAGAKEEKVTGTKAEITTSMGVIVVELAADKAPKTVANFVEYANSGFYNDTVFHRIISDFMIQGGGYTTKYERKDTRAPVKNEADNGLKNDRGTIAMARTGDPDSATAQFFINVKDNPALNHREKTPPGWGYCVFGKVVKGMEIVDKIKDVKTGAHPPDFAKDAPVENVVIKSVKILK